jgi:hypothetical protein
VPRRERLLDDALLPLVGVGVEGVAYLLFDGRAAGGGDFGVVLQPLVYAQRTGQCRFVDVSKAQELLLHHVLARIMLQAIGKPPPTASPAVDLWGGTLKGTCHQSHS